MSSSDEEDAFNVKALMRKQKKKAAAASKPVVSADFSCELDDMLIEEAVAFNVPQKTEDDDLRSSDEEFANMTALEKIRLKKKRRAEKAKPIEKKAPIVSAGSSSEDEEKPTLRRGTRNRKRTSCDRSTSSDENDNTVPQPKKRSPNKDEEEENDDEICVLSTSIATVSCDVPKPAEIVLEDDDDIDVRYLVKDFSDKAIASFFFPANAKVNDIQEKFKDKLDPSLPYLYFFTDALDPINPENTPIEMGWDLSEIITLRIRQSSQISFHLAEKQKPQELPADAPLDNKEDGRILIKFQVKDKHKPFKILIDPADTFGKIKADFCKEHQMDVSKCFLIFDNERVQDAQTPNDYEMEKNDCVDVHIN
uniref:Ubiquitin-like domain-containing protein n=1 Tax=Steinernema glaseri TaxID=37863 RepID=A0A1I7XYT5_9BILA